MKPTRSIFEPKKSKAQVSQKAMRSKQMTTKDCNHPEDFRAYDKCTECLEDRIASLYQNRMTINALLVRAIVLLPNGLAKSDLVKDIKKALKELT